jgi:RNA polymerase sigma-70 factor (ECF subfamily)
MNSRGRGSLSGDVSTVEKNPQGAFDELVEPHRSELHAHCYRMLGSLHDAEDALQESLLRAWRAQDQLAERAALRPWLYRIATNVCLDAIRRRPKRVLPVDYGPASGRDEDPSEPVVESVWIEPYPDEVIGVENGYASPDATYEQREAVELAFVAALQHLPPNQRAALILRDVLGYSAQETAEALDTSRASVNSALQRARVTVEERLPERSQQANLRQLGNEETRRLAERYADAWSRADLNAIAALLAEDATFAMPPIPEWWRGRDNIIELQARLSPSCPASRCLPTSASGQPALGWYAWDDEKREWLPSALEVLTLDGERVTDITAFVDGDLHRRFGLPEKLPAEPPRSS